MFHKFGHCCHSCVNMFLIHPPPYPIPQNMHRNTKWEGNGSLRITHAQKNKPFAAPLWLPSLLCLHRIERSPKYLSLLVAVFLSFLFRLQTFPQIEILVGLLAKTWQSLGGVQSLSHPTAKQQTCALGISFTLEPWTARPGKIHTMHKV